MLAGISADERTIYFYRMDEPSKMNDKLLLEAKRSRTDVPFSAAEKLQTTAPVVDAAVSADQLTCVVSSFPEGKRRELWWADRRTPTEAFPELQNLSIPGEPDAHPVLSSDGLTLLGTRGGDIFMWTRAARGQPFANAQRLPDSINKPAWEMPAFISNDRLLAIVMSQSGNTPETVVRYVTYHTRASEHESFGAGKPLNIPLGISQNSNTNSGFRLTGDGRSIYFSCASDPGGRVFTDVCVSRLVRKGIGRVPSANTPATLDLLPLVDLSQEILEGEWTKDSAGFKTEKLLTNSWLRLPVEPGEEYSLRTAFSTNNGNVSLILPLENKGLEIVLTNKRVELCLNYLNAPQNSRTELPFTVYDNKRHECLIEVTRPSDNEVKIVVTVDGTPGLEWQGTREQLRTSYTRPNMKAALSFGSYLPGRGGPAKLLAATLTTTRGTAKPLRDNTLLSSSPTAPTSSKLWIHDPAFALWMKDVQALPADKQVEAVTKKLIELNPGFDGKLVLDLGGRVTPKIENNRVTEFGFFTNEVSDISPVRALQHLRVLYCGCNAYKRTPGGKLTDLAPLQGLPLESLDLDFNTQLDDLSPLRGLPLTKLNCTETLVADLTPLRGMPLRELNLDRCPITDLSPLQGMKLSRLKLHRRYQHEGVQDYTPLSELPLTDLSLRDHRKFSDLSILRGLPLTSLDCDATAVSDLSPLAGMQLTKLIIGRTKVTDLVPLRGMPLEHLEIAQIAGVTSLAPLEGLPLKKLFCNETSVTDVTPLEKCANLSTLKLTKTRVTVAGVAALQKALPNCKIEWDDPATVPPK